MATPIQQPVTVYCCSMGGNIANVDPLRPLIADLGMKLVTMSEWPTADIPWDRLTWLHELSKADIIICPQRHSLQPAKSNNRVSQAQSLGKPVLASPLRAYHEAITNGVDGFICQTLQDWYECLKALRDDPELRERIGKAAKMRSEKQYSIDATGRRWVDLIGALSRESCNPPAVDIIIPTWNNLDLLKECIKSIRLNTDWPYQIIVVNSGTDGTEEWLVRENPDIISHNTKTRLHFSAANNIGLRLGQSPFVCFLNDDTIVAKHWLPAMMHEAMKPGVGGVNPFSNCDIGWLHNETMTVEGVQLHPGMVYKEVADIIPQLYAYKHPKVVTSREWLAFYCTVIPREIIDKVGELDENFKSGCEDLDYCKRIQQAGNYRFVTTFDSFVFHFGGSTRKNAEKFDHSIHHREDKENQEYLQKKYSGNPPPTPMFPSNQPQPVQPTKPIEPDRPVYNYQPQPAQQPQPAHGVRVSGLPAHIKLNVPAPAPAPQQSTIMVPATIKQKQRLIIFTGPGWEQWSPKSIDNGGIGGSETCAVYVAREFAKQGYDVTVCGDPSDSEVGNYDGVQYTQWNKWTPSPPIDILISSRRPDIFSAPVAACARKRICWVHDIWLHSDPHMDINVDKIHKFFVLSPWHKQFFCNHHRVPEHKIYVTRDAIDLDRFDKSLPRVRGRMVYSSSPDRGLDVLLDCFPRIRKVVPEATLKIFYGFKNWQLAIEKRRNPHEMAWMDRILEQINQPGVTNCGRVGQDQLCKEYLQAELWGYPTSFTETFCMTACEAMAAGVPAVTSNLAALSTTVGDAGILIEGDNKSEAYQNTFVEICTTVLTNQELWSELSIRGKKKVAEYRWDTLVSDWIKELS